MKKLITRLGKGLYSDSHECWKRKPQEKEEKKEEREGNKEGKGNEEGEENGNGEGKRSGNGKDAGAEPGVVLSAEQARSLARMWRELFGMMTAALPEEIRQRLARGYVGGDAMQALRAAEANESDYHKLLAEYCTIREKKQEDLESLDYSWYTMGLELYGNIPIVEYPESAEKPAVDDIVIAVDVSGSCGGETACRFLRETCNIIRDMEIGYEEANIRIIECDAKIQRETVIRTRDDIPDFDDRGVRGFGGTSFLPVFRRIDELRTTGEITKVRCLIYLSDGYGDFPEKAAEYDTIFVFPPDNGGLFGGMDRRQGKRNWVPEWIRQVSLTENDLEEEQ